MMVGLGRLELPTSSLSGMRSSHLSYRPGSFDQLWWSWSGSNRRPPECKSGALPAELQPLNSGPWFVVRGSRGKSRTNYALRTTNSKFIIEADWTRTPRTSPEIHRSFVLNLRKREAEAWTGTAITYFYPRPYGRGFFGDSGHVLLERR